PPLSLERQGGVVRLDGARDREGLSLLRRKARWRLGRGAGRRRRVDHPGAERTRRGRGGLREPEDAILRTEEEEVSVPPQEFRHQGPRSRRRLELHAHDPLARESAERDEPGGIEVGAQEALEGEGRRRGGGTPARAMNPRFVG